MKIVKLPYLSEKSSHLDEIWYTASDIERDYKQSRYQKLQFLKFKMATAAILKIAFLAIIINRLSDFSEILYEKAERHADKGYGKKCKCVKFKMADGRHFENR